MSFVELHVGVGKFPNGRVEVGIPYNGVKLDTYPLASRSTTLEISTHVRL